MTRPRYSRLQWNTPLSDEHADRLIDVLAPGAGDSVLDLGCGWGELLARVVARAECTGTGVDSDAELLDRGRSLLAERGLRERVTLVEGLAEDWSTPSDLVVCIGAAHAWGGTRQALRALAKIVRPGGRLLYGDGCWETPPTQHAVEIFEEVLALEEIVACVRAANWRTLHLSTAGQREWDEFESRWRLGDEDWLSANPEATDAPALREKLDERLAEYVGVYRGVLGFCYFVLSR